MYLRQGDWQIRNGLHHLESAVYSAILEGIEDERWARDFLVLRVNRDQCNR
jgi:hypothetical protein